MLVPFFLLYLPLAPEAVILEKAKASPYIFLPVSNMAVRHYHLLAEWREQAF